MPRAHREWLCRSQEIKQGPPKSGKQPTTIYPVGRVCSRNGLKYFVAHKSCIEGSSFGPLYAVGQRRQRSDWIAIVRQVIKLLKSYYVYEEIEYKDHNKSLRLFYCFNLPVNLQTLPGVKKDSRDRRSTLVSGYYFSPQILRCCVVRLT
jgi:hypothetical protein